MQGRWWRRRVGALGVAAALLVVAVPGAAAQEPDDRPPPVDAQVVGVVVDATGTAIGGAPVAVQATDTGSHIGELLTFSFLVVFSLGVAFIPCLLGDETCPYSDEETGIVGRTTTAADGSYAGTLPGAYVAGTETDTDWVVATELPAAEGQTAGPTSSFELEVNIGVQEAPPLPVWTVAPRATVNGWSVTASAPGTPAGLDAGDVRLVSSRGSLRVDGSSGRFDARVLEAAAGETQGLAVVATGHHDVRVPHANGRTIYHQRLRSAVVPTGLVPVAPSRGSACSAVRRDGQAAVVTGAAGCVLTDGDFEVPLAPPSASPDTTEDPGELTSATVELAQPIDLGLVVLHTVNDGGVVEASADGTTWTPLDTAAVEGLEDAYAVTAVPPTHVTARYVRVSGAAPLHTLTELSVWELPPGEDLDPPGPGSAAGPVASPDDDGGRSVPLRAVAAVAGVLLLAGVVLVARRQAVSR